MTVVAAVIVVSLGGHGRLASLQLPRRLPPAGSRRRVTTDRRVRILVLRSWAERREHFGSPQVQRWHAWWRRCCGGSVLWRAQRNRRRRRACRCQRAVKAGDTTVLAVVMVDKKKTSLGEGAWMRGWPPGRRERRL